MPRSDHKTTDSDRELAASTETLRRRAIKQLETKRRFRVEIVIASIAIVILVLTWALSEYHNAGGWPTHGFSQSSGIHDVWNYWIIYPVIGIALIVGARAWFVYGNRPPTETEIEREIEREKDSSSKAA
jgi:hypothetical protein